MSQGTFGPGPSSFPEGGPPKRGMSTGVKVLLIFGGVFGVLAITCCGFGIWIYNKFSNAMTTDPEQVVAIQQAIVAMDVPQHLPPQVGMDINIWGIEMKMVVFAAAGGEVLTLMQMAGAQSDPATQQQMQAEMKKQGKQPGMKVDSTETRTVTIGGEEVPFEFSTGTEEKSGRPTRQVSGAFEGRDGAVLLQYIVPEDEWDEDQVMTMLRSISP